jgi:hypothetical protein
MPQTHSLEGCAKPVSFTNRLAHRARFNTLKGIAKVPFMQ